MLKLQKETNWILTNWLGQFLFFLFISYKLATGFSSDTLRQTAWIYMSIYVLCFALSSINALCLHIPKIRETLGMVTSFGGVFIIPMTYYSLGGSVEVTSAVSLIYVLVAIAMSPLRIGSVILLFGLAYSAFIHYNNFFEQYPVFRESLPQLSEQSAIRKIHVPVSENNFKYFTVKDPATLPDISAYDSVYGNRDYWFALYEANRKLLKSPAAEVPAGTKLIVPATRGPAFRIRIFTVPREASLQEISKLPEVYGKARYWRYLFDANKSKVIDTDLNVLGGTKLIVPDLPDRSHLKFLLLSLIYVAAALVGLCWRLLMHELYRLLSIALSSSTGQTIREMTEAKEMVEQLSDDVRRLKKEIAMHIVELDQIMSYQPQKEKKK